MTIDIFIIRQFYRNNSHDENKNLTYAFKNAVDDILQKSIL
ncbi:hypothetical protein ACIAD0925 [Acinetobacter baylyi ADP1]|uniref:Uncharacterized protein n=1 Tax=Acinetobacter baylyi (strain ATCC 33305 / BD413 / ADP1) TaxID=62977 RepID=Q6FDN7_ACIAD|nr:hypothetical protein ACIAD0925 [Acinetobacter baylyi ADP1]